MTRRALPLLATLLAALLAVGGCSGVGASDGGGAETAVDGAAPQMPGPEMAEGGYAGDEEMSVQDRADDADRQVIVTGYVTVVVADPLVAADDVAALVERRDGFVAGRSQQSQSDDRRAWATLTVRVPAEDLTDVLAELDELGEVDETQLDSIEVTAQVRDLDARIRATEISIDRLEALLERTGDLADIVAAEQVLTERQAQLEQLTAERESIADQVSMSTVTINLVTDEAVPDDPPTGFTTGLASGWAALVAFGRWLATVAGVLLPWLVPVGALVGLAWWLVRRRSTRRPGLAPVSLPTEPVGATPAGSRPPAPPVTPPGPPTAE